jgi:transitional endoplasmic reticulum ATPase
VLNQILTEMDGLVEMRNVVVMGATNRLDMVDPALLRTGRFDRLVYIGEPLEEDRRKILSIHMRSMPIAGSALEDLIMAIGHLAMNNIEDLLESLGSDRTITLQEVRERGETYPKPDEPGESTLLRRSIVGMLSLHRLTLEDPVREALMASVAKKTPGYVGSDLQGVCWEAGMLAMRENSSLVEERHFEEAIKKIHPTMNERSLDFYKRMREVFKGGLPKEVQPPEYQ